MYRDYYETNLTIEKNYPLITENIGLLICKFELTTEE